MKFSLFFLSVSLIAQVTTNSVIINPDSFDNAGFIRFKEKRANGTNYINLFAAPNMASTFAMTLPNTASAGPTGTYWNLCADDTMVLTWCSTTGAGSFIDTTTNQAGLTGDKTTDGEWSFLNQVNTYSVVPVGDNLYTLGSTTKTFLTSYIKNIKSTESLEIMDSTYTTTSMELTSTYLEGFKPGGDFFVLGGFDGVGPVVSYGGRLRLYKIDGTTTKAGVGHLDSDKWESINGFSIGGSTFADGSRNTTVNNLTILGTCTGCPSGSGYVTTNTNQLSGNTGDKIWNGQWTFLNTTYMRDIQPTTNITYSLGTSAVRWLDTYTRHLYVGNASGSYIQNYYSGSSMSTFYIDTLGNNSIFLYAGSNSPFDSGVVRVNYSGAFVAEMTGAGGFDTSLPYNYNGTPGMNLTCGAGTYLFQPVFQGGILTAGSCQP